MHMPCAQLRTLFGSQELYAHEFTDVEKREYPEQDRYTRLSMAFLWPSLIDDRVESKLQPSPVEIPSISSSARASTSVELRSVERRKTIVLLVTPSAVPAPLSWP